MWNNANNIAVTDVVVITEDSVQQLD